MAQTGQLSLHLAVLDNGWASAAALPLGEVDLPFDRDELGSLNLNDHPALVADILRHAADRIESDT